VAPIFAVSISESHSRCGSICRLGITGGALTTRTPAALMQPLFQHQADHFNPALPCSKDDPQGAVEHRAFRVATGAALAAKPVRLGQSIKPDFSLSAPTVARNYNRGTESGSQTAQKYNRGTEGAQTAQT
jgi:hypothetical protein